MIAARLKVKLNLKIVNVQAKEHLLPEFLKINPQHTVPTLVDNNFALWESRAICIYLVEKYAKDDSLYPKNPKQRAIVNQRLYFDLDMLTFRINDFFFSQLVINKDIDLVKFKKMEEALVMFNTLLRDSDYAAGEKLTIADFALAVTASVIELTGYDLNKHSSISRWLRKIKSEVQEWKINEDGLNILREITS